MPKDQTLVNGTFETENCLANILLKVADFA